MIVAVHDGIYQAIHVSLLIEVFFHPFHPLSEFEHLPCNANIQSERNLNGYHFIFFHLFSISLLRSTKYLWSY